MSKWGKKEINFLRSHQNLSRKQLAKHFKTSTEAIRKVERRNNFPIRVSNYVEVERRRKISKKLTGRKPWNIGKTIITDPRLKKIAIATSRIKKGKKLFIKHRRNISDAHKKIINWNYKGGIESENKKIRKSFEYKLWRDAVFKKNNWTCQKYGVRGGKLHPHHILNFSQYPELRFAIDNGITLSEKAHKEFHKLYGIINNTKEQLHEFLSLK